MGSGKCSRGARDGTTVSGAGRLKAINRKILEQVLAASAEPLLIIRIDHPDWPVALSNEAFQAIGGKDVRNKPFADVVEQLVGRELALEISEAIRRHEETSLPIELGGREYLLALRPLSLPNEPRPKFYAAFWRAGVYPGVAQYFDDRVRARTGAVTR